MKELKREAMIDTNEQLLFDILQELKKLNEKLKPEDTKSETLLECKYCNGTHENKYQIMACAKKNKKKEGVKK